MDNKITARFISMEDILEAGCFDIDKTIVTIEDALIAFKKGRIMLPDKISQVFDENTQERINCMAASLLDEKISGVKWVSVFPQNPVRFDVPNVSGLIVLSELEKGYPIAVMDGTFITSFRTACMGALASKYLAKKDCKTIGLIGSGEQAKMHLITLKHVHPELKVCCIASCNDQHETAFIDLMRDKYPEMIFRSCHSDYDAATSDADIIVTAVSCQAPLLKAKAIKEGAFYIHVGGWEDEYAVPLKASKIVCDRWDAVKHRTQTLSRLYKNGSLHDEDIYADIVDIIDGTFPGRENDMEFIYFNSVGLAFIDIAIAQSFYSKVAQSGSGTTWNIKNSDFWSGFFSKI